jgi:hypothetical protein
MYERKPARYETAQAHSASARIRNAKRSGQSDARLRR